MIRRFFLAALVGVLGLLQSTTAFSMGTEIRWKWKNIPYNDEGFWTTLTFPKDFVWGVAASAFQMEGNELDNGACKNNWTESSNVPRAGVGNGHWRLWKTDVQLLKQLGIKAYRLSIEWSKIEPQQGFFDQEAMQHYIDLCNELLANGIEPIVCLFHHTWPDWFSSIKAVKAKPGELVEYNAFEHSQNIKYFVRYAQYVFEKLHSNVKTWMTFNEPEGYAIEGYYRGKYPPFKKSLKLAGKVLKNMLNAHVEVYQVFKRIDPTVSIGFTKVMNPIDPYNPWNPLEQTACRFFSSLLHDTTLDFFETGKFSWGYSVSDTNKLVPQCLDYIGLNYYSHTVIQHQQWPFKLDMSSRPSEKKADSGKSIYPEGLYRCIKRCARLGKPIYIAENGIADEHGAFRNEYIRQHLFVISKALQKGYDIRGYFYWSPFDTYNWNSAFSSKYGLYAVDFATLERTLRPSAESFVQFMHAWNAGVLPSARSKNLYSVSPASWIQEQSKTLDAVKLPEHAKTEMFGLFYPSECVV